MELMLKPEIYTFTQLTEAEFLKHQAALKPVIVPLEQSPVWGAFNDSIAGRKFLGSFRYDDTSGKLVGLASATLYKEKGRNWIWIKHGPIFATEPNTEVIQKMCATLKTQFGTTQYDSPLFIRLSMVQKTAGLVLPFEHTMYDETVVIDLTKTEDEILAGMSQSGRQGIRKAAKASVTVAEISENYSDYFAKHCYPILKETGARDGFGIHPLSLYTTMLTALPEYSRLYVALHNKSVEAWMITTEYNGQAMYYYGASSAKARETFAAYALQWEVIKVMKTRGNSTYDLMGIAGKHYSGLKNVTQFKTKFSKNIVSIPFTYDLPIQRFRYQAFALALKAKRRLKR